MADRDTIIAFCDELLACDSFQDYCPNGLQVPGAEEVETIVSGVSAHLELFERAVAEGGQLVLVHHGLLWHGSAAEPLSVATKRRLKLLFDHDLSLAAYHLPLDAHRKVGNNALLCEGVGFEADPAPFAEVRGASIGVIGRHAEGVSTGVLVQRLVGLLGRDPLVFDGGPETIRSVGFVSGAGAALLRAAADAGLDALVTGEPAERAMADSREAGLHFIAAGHYATETLGVRRLGEMLAERFGVRHSFCDIPNPV